ncbi:FAD-dependent oxidoreductase [Propioniciclava sp. MC1683]|uniref:protoporphyrinogen/coproporphyrinogen oxidase n=1 Tax=Propioniciclava sp. MC1683 TaxID=2760309 RepID=UPI0015FF493A|nr:FAD-dependent oxidoreductase [Propioniciclava sp. MC1683]MBB1500002.1 FAD-dependent oxidoreductase [Propioniciclava sp. MC1683]
MTLSRATQHVPAVVVGGGIGGLQAAHTFAKLGLAPLLLESRGTCGGLIFGAPIGGVWVDLGAESFAKRSVATAELCRELGLDVVDPSGNSWLWSHRDGGFAFRIPHGVLGIPTDLDDPIVVDLLSPEGLARAREDLTMGPEAGADAADLASLVVARLGEEVLTRLVDPIAGGVHSAHPSELSVDVVSPGLRRALASEGSLVRAAAALRASAPAGGVVSSASGGLFTLPRALVARIGELGGTVAGRRVVTAIARDGDRWAVTHHEAGRAPDPADPPVPVGEPQVVTTDRLVVALDGRAALDLLRTVPELEVDDWQLPKGADLAQVCIVLDAPELDAGPRGSGLLVTPDAEDADRRVACKAITHYSIKWPGVVAGSGKHVLRVSYGRAGVPTPEPTLSGALADAGVLLGVPLAEEQVVGHAVIHFPNSLPPQTPAHRVRVADLTERLAGTPGLAITGAWFAGTGLAAVIPHAERVAKELA